MSTPHKPRLILVCGPWSSGTTAVSGMLNAMGLNGLGPFFHTNDARTPNSYESQAFRNLVQTLAREETVTATASHEQVLEALRGFRKQVLEGRHGPLSGDAPLFLKYPLSALFIPEICQVFDTRLVFVLRPLKEIEATRQRRGWAPFLGSEGAKRIYAHMFHVLVNMPTPVFVMRYPELLARPEAHTRQLATFCGVKPTQAQMETATGFIRRPASGAAKSST
jgi:hypothetical protein